MSEDDRPSRWRRAVHRITAEVHELDAEDLRQQAETAGAVPLASCVDRQPATVYGTVRSLTIRPRGGNPALEAELYDGSGVLTLVFIGRRTIAGIEPGRALRASGRVTMNEGRRVIFNPRYELLPD